jgi:hypothetical protein
MAKLNGFFSSPTHNPDAGPIHPDREYAFIPRWVRHVYENKASRAIEDIGQEERVKYARVSVPSEARAGNNRPLKRRPRFKT